MEQLWAPWRYNYIVRASSKKIDGCFICRGLSEAEDRANLLVQRSEHSVVLLNQYPYNNGHLLVAPKLHKAQLNELTPEEMLDGQEIITQMIGKLEKLMKPDGFNVGLNLGRSAGAGLPGHLHWHIVPRWNGDTNFMSVLADVNVISQSLDSLYELLTNPDTETTT
jgi:ATP adenylyltransferase